jgi:hypothetical protein
MGLLCSVNYFIFVVKEMILPHMEGSFPSEQPTGRRLFGAEGCEALPRAPLKGLFEKSPLRNLKNFS